MRGWREVKGYLISVDFDSLVLFLQDLDESVKVFRLSFALEEENLVQVPVINHVSIVMHSERRAHEMRSFHVVLVELHGLAGFVHGNDQPHSQEVLFDAEASFPLLYVSF